MRVVPLLPELKVAPHFERTTPNRSTVSLNVMLLPHERHGHLRPPAADLATTYAGELREWCAGRGAARRALGSRPSCAGIDAGLLAVKHHSEKLLEVTAARDDAHIVAAALAERPEPRRRRARRRHRRRHRHRRPRGEGAPRRLRHRRVAAAGPAGGGA